MIIFIWCVSELKDTLQKIASYEYQISINSVSHWYKRFREIWMRFIEENPEILGRLYDDAQITVEVDEFT